MAGLNDALARSIISSRCVKQACEVGSRITFSPRRQRINDEWSGQVFMWRGNCSALQVAPASHKARVGPERSTRAERRGEPGRLLGVPITVPK